MLGFIVLLLVGLPLWFFGEWFFERFAGPWGERTPWMKAAKFLLLVLIGFLLVIVSGLCTMMVAP